MVFSIDQSCGFLLCLCVTHSINSQSRAGSGGNSLLKQVRGKERNKFNTISDIGHDFIAKHHAKDMRFTHITRLIKLAKRTLKYNAIF